MSDTAVKITMTPDLPTPEFEAPRKPMPAKLMLVGMPEREGWAMLSGSWVWFCGVGAKRWESFPAAQVFRIEWL